MSEGLNKVLLIGNLGADPELKFTQGGQAMLRIRLATTERYQDKGGERQERTEWHTVTIWGNRAEALEKFLTKGKTIYVEGRIQSRQWEDKEGQKRTTTEINATQILLLGGGGGAQHSERSASEPTHRPRPVAAKPANELPFAEDDNGDDDDIPF